MALLRGHTAAGMAAAALVALGGCSHRLGAQGDTAAHEETNKT
jgi:hypothetical protein